MTAHPAAPGPRSRRSAADAGADGPVADESLVREVRVGRQALYDADGQVMSYEITFRPSQDVAVSVDEALTESATSQVITATFGTFGLESVSGGKPVFITFTRGFLTGMLPLPVEPDRVIVEVTDQVGVDHELLLGLAALKQNGGYRIAVDNYRGDLGRSALVELADFVVMDVASLPSIVLPGLVQTCRLVGATLVARNVEDAAMLRRCTDLGFELFSGEHFERPGELHRRALSPQQMVCVRLLDQLADVDAPPDRIADLVGADPGLAMRLLTSAHSVSGAGQGVGSLHQAVVLIGPARLRSWVVLSLLEGHTAQHPTEDLWNVLTLALSCRRLAPGCADLAYTVGLLAGVARLLGVEPAEVAEASGIGQEAAAALVHELGPAGRALEAVRAHETGDVARVDGLGFDPAEVARVHLQSLHDCLQQARQATPR